MERLRELEYEIAILRGKMYGMEAVFRQNMDFVMIVLVVQVIVVALLAATWLSRGC